MVRPIRSEQHPDLGSAIKSTAWELISREGASALSLRAIARQLGITAPAIYNYYPRRDDLVTALILDAFDSFAEAQRSAQVRVKDTASFRTGFIALGMAFRDWALAYPQRYQLIFGTPIPGYSAPADITVPAAGWALVPLTETIQAAWQSGLIEMYGYDPMQPDLQTMFDAWRSFAGPIDQEVLYLALAVWTRVHGFVSLEIGSQLPSFLTDPGLIFQRELDAICRNILKK